MQTLISIFLWILGIAVGGLMLIGLLFVFFWVFKFLCAIHAEIIAEKMREVLEELQEERQSPVE